MWTGKGKKTKTIITISPDFLLNNYIDKELREVLTPLTITDRLIVSMKFQIKDNFITSNSKMYILLSLLVNCALISFHVCRAVYMEAFQYNQVSSFRLLIFINIASMIVEFIINFRCVLDSDTIVKMLLKLQEIDRNLNILDSKRYARYKFIAWSLTLFLISCQLFTAVTNTLFIPDYSFIQFYVTMSRFFFDMNMIYIIIVMDFLTSRIGIWTSKVEILSTPEADVEEWRGKTALLLDTYRGFLQVLAWMQKVFEWPVSMNHQVRVGLAT